MEACEIHTRGDSSAVFCDTVKQQMSSILAMAVACKMRLAGPDSSRLVLQSLIPSSSVAAEARSGLLVEEVLAGQHSADPTGSRSAHHQPLHRRYSATQSSQDREGGESLDTHTDQLLQMFMSSSSPPGRHSGYRELAPVSEVGDQLLPQRGMTRQGSSPVLSSLEQASSAGGLAHGPLTRRASSTALHSFGDLHAHQNNVSVSPTNPSPAASGHTTGGAISTAFHTTTETSKLGEGSSVDNVDSSLGPHKKQGFGILSRTRQFGAWLGNVTKGEKMEVTKQDLNVFAPTSF
ncbi:hypothetical protein PoB_004467400 [Plakobranchus ocellatus]|uniref:Uncharacterized protein n=1 Tax=Plakobranchus ocellatus TaxID=259542 RepID=A0AAV4BDG1_9GAST|nr:hypothetical protein PoB_004467400 [Plakobranchus ocellatus]